MNPKIERELDILWRSVPDKGTPLIKHINFTLDFLLSAELILPLEAELWNLRVKNCPDHNDGEGRSWCAYCGNLPVQAQDGVSNEE